MLIDGVNFDITEFKQIFKKKFDNFCKKAPILMSYILVNDSIDIYSYDDNKQSLKLFSYSFDYTKGVKENIKSIKDILLADHYPRMTQNIIIYSDYTPEELNQLVSEGKVSIDEIGTAKREQVQITTWRIERVIVIRDEIFIRNMLTNEEFRYRMKIPVTVFLKKCRTNFTPEEAWDYFENKSILKNAILPNYHPSLNHKE
jgi:hypothetical protein